MAARGGTTLAVLSEKTCLSSLCHTIVTLNWVCFSHTVRPLMGFFDFFTAKQRRVQNLVAKYMDVWIGCIRSFRDTWDVYAKEGISEEFYFRVKSTHKEESRADDMRRDIELELYSKALIPESRGDILGLLESVDILLSQAERVLYDIQLQKMDIPDEVKVPFEKMVDITCSCCEVVNKAVRVIFVENNKTNGLMHLVHEIDNLESEADHLERRLIRTILKLDIETGFKLMLKEMVRQLARVTDQAEHVGDRLTIVSVKRRV